MRASLHKKWMVAIAVVVVLSVATYPLSLGPLFYLNGTGYLGDSVFDTLLATVFAPCLNLADSNGPYADYLYWWMERGADAYAVRMQESAPASAQSNGQTVAPVEQTLAGRYYQGDGLGFNLDLHLREDGTFACSCTGCLGENGTTDGTWIRVGDRIVVTTDNADGEFAGRSLGSMMIVQHDGETRLLRDVDAELATEPELLPYFSFGRNPETP